MALKSDFDIGGRKTAAVVLDLDQFLAAGLELDRDSIGSGVNGVFDQFLDH